MSLVMAVCTACHDDARHLSEAKTLYETGLQRRAAKQTDGADSSFCNLVLGLSYYYLDQEDKALMNGLNDDRTFEEIIGKI